MTTGKLLRAIFYETGQDKRVLMAFFLAVLVLFIGMATNIYVPILFKNIVENYSGNKNSGSWILIAYAFIWTLNQITYNLRSLFVVRIEERSAQIIATKVFTHIYRLSLKNYMNQKMGFLTNAIRRAQNNVPKILCGTLFCIIPTIIEFSIVFTILSKYYTFSLVLVFWGTIFLFIAYTFGATKIAFKVRQAANQVDRCSEAILFDWLWNYEAVKLFGMERKAANICKSELQNREKAEVRSTSYFDFIAIGQKFVIGCGLCLITYLLGIEVAHQRLTIGDFILFNGYLIQFIAPLNMIEAVIRHVKKAFIDMKDIVAILSQEPKIKEVKNPISLKSNHPCRVEFRNVSYSHKDQLILDNVSFVIPPGEKVFVIGKTGMGKSTLLKLILRQYDVDNGQILINGIDIQKIALNSLYRNVGIVPQDTILFNDTIRANISFAKPQATLEEIKIAAELAGLKEVIESLYLKYETVVGERGLKLSGGEKQRISLARLFLRQNNLCLFDEPTSALDGLTKEKIQENIDKAFPHSTKVTVTHQLSSIKEEDCVFLLRNGKISLKEKEKVFS